MTGEDRFDPLRIVRARLASHGRPLRFLVAGVINTLFGLAIFPALLWSSDWLHRHYMVALLIAQVASVLFAFAAYRFGVFRTKGGMARQFGLFSSFYIVNYVINWIALPLLVEFGGLKPWIAQLGFACVVMIGSYYWHSRVTFREGPVEL